MTSASSATRVASTKTPSGPSRTRPRANDWRVGTAASASADRITISRRSCLAAGGTTDSSRTTSAAASACTNRRTSASADAPVVTKICRPAATRVTRDQSA